MKKFIALIVVLCAVMISSTTASAANWVWIYSNDYFTVYVDNSSIRRDYNYHGYVFRAFIKKVYTDAGRRNHIEFFRSRGFVPHGIYNLAYDITLQYFKAENGIKYVAILNCTAYDHNGDTISEISSSDTYPPQWVIIPPDSVGEAIFDTIYARVPN